MRACALIYAESEHPALVNTVTEPVVKEPTPVPSGIVVTEDRTSHVSCVCEPGDMQAVSSSPFAIPRSAFLENNIAALELGTSTAALVRAATPRGTVEYLGDRTPTLRVGEQRLGAPPESTLISSWARDIEQDQGLLAVFGLGMGHMVRALRQRTEAPMVVFEPDAGLLRTVLEYGPSDLGGVAVACTRQDLTRFWLSHAWKNPVATVVRTPGYGEMFPEQHSQFTEEIEQLVARVRTNANTYRLRARSWVEHLLANLEVLIEHTPFMALSGQFRDLPCFIVGAGPSLDKNATLLGQAVQKGLVMALNTSAGALARRGIEPQVLMCLEALDVSSALQELPFINRVVRAFSLTVHPHTMRTGAGPLLPVYEGVPEIDRCLRALTGLAGLPVSASVSTMAFSLAKRLGCNPIVMVGHDLAYTGGRAYADGSTHQGSRARASADGTSVEFEWSASMHQDYGSSGNCARKSEPAYAVTAWGGEGTVLSGATFLPVKSWLAQAACELAERSPQVRLINATEGGARIEGFLELRLEQVLGTLCGRTITPEQLAQAARVRPALGRDAVSRWVTDQRRQAQILSRTARRMQVVASASLKAIARGEPQRVKQSYQALERAERELSRAAADSPLIGAWAFASLEQATLGGAPHRDARSSAEGAIRQEKNLASALESSVMELERELGVLETRLRTRTCSK